jgi:hypothetical protein
MYCSSCLPVVEHTRLKEAAKSKFDVVVCIGPTDHTPASAKVSFFSFSKENAIPTFPIFQDHPGYWIYPLVYVSEQTQWITTNDCSI